MQLETWISVPSLSIYFSLNKKCQPACGTRGNVRVSFGDRECLHKILNQSSQQLSQLWTNQPTDCRWHSWSHAASVTKMIMSEGRANMIRARATFLSQQSLNGMLKWLSKPPKSNLGCVFVCVLGGVTRVCVRIPMCVKKSQSIAVRTYRCISDACVCVCVSVQTCGWYNIL